MLQYSRVDITFKLHHSVTPELVNTLHIGKEHSATMVSDHKSTIKMMTFSA